MRAILIALMACVCGVALAWELPATRRAMMMDAMTPPAAGGGTLGEGLVVHYLCNDNAATTNVLDNKGAFNGGSGRNTALMSVAGKIGSGFKMDGTNDFVLTGFKGILENSNRTVSVWTKLDNGTKTSVAIYYGQNGVAAGYTFNLAWNAAYTAPPTTNYLHVSFDGGRIMKVGSYSDNQWHHIAVTHNGTNQYLWIDGTNATSTSYTLATKPVQPFNIGRYHTLDSGAYFQGVIDDVRVYDRVLSTNEILQLYNGGAGTEDE